MKRAAQTAARSASGSNRLSPGVRIVRNGQTVPPETTEASHAEEIQYVTAAPRDIVVGDKVKLLSFGSVGIVDQIKEGYAEVRVKALRFREKLENLELVEQQPAAKSARTSGEQTGKLEKLRRSSGTEVHLSGVERNARSELNVIGQTTDEAVDAVDKFLDEASLASLSQVRIVHGHGTGALRRAIASLLGDHPHVARFVAAPPDQGGTGATLVELRQ
jgi:DNA mismatch repair protein MutS2